MKHLPKILIACEESDQVRHRFEKIGFNAWSCDIQPNRSGTKKHLQIDLMQVLKIRWDAIIAFPPCTHLSNAGSRHFAAKKADGRQQESINFFLKIAENKSKFIAIENPLGIMSTIWRKPDQIIHPYFFGDETMKRTCLWLKNLPKLYHNKTANLFDANVTHVSQGKFYYWKTKSGKIKRQNQWFYDAYADSKNRHLTSKIRSETFPGIAEAMASQWGAHIMQNI